jgi:hypothetical protein
MPPLHALTIGLLWLNGLWDMACVGGMLLLLLRCWGDATPDHNNNSNREEEDEEATCVTPHWALWAQAADRGNPAARLLFGALVLLWGGVRLIAAACLFYSYAEKEANAARWFATWTYVIESALLLVGAKEILLMRRERALMAAALCLPMLLLLTCLW